MNASPKIVALVPMRHHSQRVPGKNYRPMAGKPLFYYIIESLLACVEINQIVVDTDSDPIIEAVQQQFPTVTLINRPMELRADTISMNEILAYDVSIAPADFYLQTHSTNPLLKPATIQKAIHTFLNNYPAYDSLFGVTRLQVRLYDQLGRALNHNPAILLQTQDLPPVFMENSCIYLFSASTLLQRRNRLGERPYMFEIDPLEGWDIDNELDFSVVEFLMGKMARGEEE